jgi:hypothetical protein
MPVTNTTFSTITCEQCKKTITYPAGPQEQEILSQPDNSWVIKTARLVQNLVPAPGMQRPHAYLYCSDECEVTATGSGAHNVPEPKKIISNAASAASVAQAAAVAKAAEAATAALKAGQPAIIPG